MPNISAGVLIGTLLGATTMLFAPLPSAWGASATGHAVVGLGDDNLRILSFSATSVDPDESNATGQIHFQDPTPTLDQDVDRSGGPDLEDAPHGVTLQADVDCLQVDDHQAVIGGQVTRASVSRYVGNRVLLFVEDGSQSGSPSRVEWGFYEAATDTDCGSFPLAAHDAAVEIESGVLQVQQ
jgi:hypothetical protein